MRVEELEWEVDDPEDGIFLLCTNPPPGLQIHQCLRHDDVKDDLQTEVGTIQCLRVMRTPIC